MTNDPDHQTKQQSTMVEWIAQMPAPRHQESNGHIYEHWKSRHIQLVM